MARIMVVMICGVIASGKTLVKECFSKDLFIPVDEPVSENKRLESFYAELNFIDKLKAIGVNYHSKVTPMMEIDLALSRRDLIYYYMEQASQKVSASPGTFCGIITDFGIPAVFAKMLFGGGYLSGLDYKTFLEVYRHLEIVPDLVIYLDSLKYCMENMERRGRECEKNIDISYQKALDKAYKEELETLKSKGSRVGAVKWGKADKDSGTEINTILELNGFPKAFDVEKFQRLVKE